MRALWQDLTYSARILLKKPALTFVTVLTFALAIGANSAIFGVVNAILLRPLPFKDQERLVVLWHSYPQLSLLKSPVSPPGFVSYKEQGQTFDAVAAMAYRGLNLTGQDEPEQIQGMFVSADFFPALGVRPLIGRTFTPEEDQPGRNRVVILGQSFWQRRFGADRGILDKPITLNGIDFTVVGVMPSDFQLFGRADFWSPIALAPAQVGPNQFGNEYLTVVARLKPGVSFPQAQAAMDNLSSQMRQQYPQFYPESSGWHVTLVPLREELVGNFRPTLLLLLGAVGLVLLIACANVANLLLAQSATRHKEFATRVALGASRRRIIRQLLTESALLSLLGGAAGLLLALWGSGAIVANLPPDVTKSLPSWEAIGVDARMLVFTLAVTLLTGALFGVVPALTVSKLGTSAVLNEAGRGGARNRQRQQAP